MFRHHRNHRAIVALVAAYGLSLQMLFAAAGLGTAAGPIDPFFASICASAASRQPQDMPALPADHDHAGCCILCAVPGLAAVDFDAAPIAFANASFLFLMTPLPGVALRGAVERRPGQPRAPPAIA